MVSDATTCWGQVAAASMWAICFNVALVCSQPVLLCLLYFFACLLLPSSSVAEWGWSDAQRWCWLPGLCAECGYASLVALLQGCSKPQLGLQCEWYGVIFWVACFQENTGCFFCLHFLAGLFFYILVWFAVSIFWMLVPWHTEEFLFFCLVVAVVYTLYKRLQIWVSSEPHLLLCLLLLAW